SAQFRKDLGEIIGQETVAGGVVVGANLWHFPARKIRVDAVQERRVLKFGRERLKKMPVLPFRLTYSDVGVNVAAQNNRARRGELLVAAIELPCLHVILEHVEARLNIVETDV